MNGNGSGTVRVVGSLRSADGVGVIRIEDRFDTGIEELWSALTEAPRLARWYGEIEGDLRSGGTFRSRERCDARTRFAELEPAYRDLAARI